MSFFVTAAFPLQLPSSREFAAGLKKLGTVQVQDPPFFDTVKITSVVAYELCLF